MQPGSGIDPQVLQDTLAGYLGAALMSQAAAPESMSSTLGGRGSMTESDRDAEELHQSQQLLLNVRSLMNRTGSSLGRLETLMTVLAEANGGLSDADAAPPVGMSFPPQPPPIPEAAIYEGDGSVRQESSSGRLHSMMAELLNAHASLGRPAQPPGPVHDSGAAAALRAANLAEQINSNPLLGEACFPDDRSSASMPPERVDEMQFQGMVEDTDRNLMSLDAEPPRQARVNQPQRSPDSRVLSGYQSAELLHNLVARMPVSGNFEELARQAPELWRQATEALGGEGSERRDVEEEDSALDSALPSYGSSGHFMRRCKPCLFWYRGMCLKGERCHYCHIPHDLEEVKKVRPSKATRNLLRQLQERNRR